MSSGVALFRALVERASDFALLTDADGRVLYVSPAVTHILGYAPEEIERHSGFAFIHPDDVDRRRTARSRLVHSPLGTVEVDRFRVRDARGDWRHVEQRSTNLLDDPEVRGVASSLRDVTASVEADQALAASHRELERLTAVQERLLERYRTAVEATGLGVWEYDAEVAEIVWTADPDLAARAATAGLDPGPHDIQDLWQLIHPDDADAWLATVQGALDRGESFSTEYRVLLPQGERRWEAFGRTVDHAGRRRVFGTVRDVTDLRAGEERLRAQQEQLARAQRFSSMGELAAGLAHDVSNLMTVVAGRADLLAMRLGEDDEDVAELAAVARRGRDLLRRVTSFARGGGPSQETSDLVQAVRDVAASAPQLLGPDVMLDLVLEDGVPPVAMAAADLGQVLTNLCVNAAQAMPEGGHLAITVGACVGDASSVALVVADEGTGIPPGQLEAVFDPFVTTRTRQGGTGLGLAIVYRLVTDAGGRIDVDSEVGRGTTMRLVLPAAPRAG